MSAATKRVAIVTGAAQGIGLACARALAAKGMAVALFDLDGEAATRAAAELSDAGHEAIAVQCDVTKSDQVVEAVGGVAARWDHIDVLVNNVGWNIHSPFIDQSEDFWDRVIAVNLKGMILMSHAVVKQMVAQDSGGKIVSIASDAGRVGTKGETVYAAAKGGVIAFTKSLAREMARYSINVNCVSPGPTETPQLARETANAPALMEKMIRAIPLRRPAKPEEQAAAVAFLASSDADYITGQVLSVNGGLQMVG